MPASGMRIFLCSARTAITSCKSPKSCAKCFTWTTPSWSPWIILPTTEVHSTSKLRAGGNRFPNTRSSRCIKRHALAAKPSTTRAPTSLRVLGDIDSRMASPTKLRAPPAARPRRATQHHARLRPAPVDHAPLVLALDRMAALRRRHGECFCVARSTPPVPIPDVWKSKSRQPAATPEWKC